MLLLLIEVSLELKNIFYIPRSVLYIAALKQLQILCYIRILARCSSI